MLNAKSALALLGCLLTVSCSSADTQVQTGSTGERTTYAYKQVGGSEILADVYFRGEPDSPQPVLLWIHGGGLIFGTRQRLPGEQLQRYLDAGFTVVAIDHRFVPETKIPEIVEDVRDAYDWIRTEGPSLFNADPDRVTVVGHSSGGYLTLVSGYVLDPPPRALVSVYGFGDITGDWTVQPNPAYMTEPAISREAALAVVGKENISTEPPGYDHFGRPLFFRYTKQQGSWVLMATGRDPAAEARWFEAFEPIRNVTADYPPTLLIHGERDTDVPFQQSVRMSEVLSSNGIPNQLIVNPEWEHLFDTKAPEDKQVQAVFATVVDFLTQHVQP